MIITPFPTIGANLKSCFPAVNALFPIESKALLLPPSNPFEKNPLPLSLAEPRCLTIESFTPFMPSLSPNFSTIGSSPLSLRNDSSISELSFNRINVLKRLLAPKPNSANLLETPVPVSANSCRKPFAILRVL